jgi:hypothetical protein
MFKSIFSAVGVVAVMVSATFGQNAGVAWTVVDNSHFEGKRITSIVYGKDKFIAVGGGKMAYSPDGITWTAVHNSPFGDNDYPSIVYGKDMFVAVWGNKMAYSSDGIAWTGINNILSGDQYPQPSVTYGNNRFVARSYRKIAYSLDGIAWSAIENDSFRNIISGSSIRSIVWGDKQFVARLMDCEDGTDNCWHNIMTSPDGISWTKEKKNNLGNGYYDIIAWDNKKIIGFRAASELDGTESEMGYSSDGISWIKIKNVPLVDCFCYGSAIVWGNNKFVAGCASCWSGGCYGMVYSLDGKNWKVVDNYPFGEKTTAAIAYGNGTFVASSCDGKIAYSK